MSTWCDDEGGLSLVEMMVAMLITGIILMAMATVAIASLHSVQSSERVVHATQLGNEVLEGYLATDYENLGLYESDATAVFGGTTFDGDPIVVFPDAATPAPEVPQAEATIERQGITYTVRTAVVADDVEPSDPLVQPHKRLVVQLDWDVRGQSHSTQVEALRAPAPGEQPLTVTIEPDVIDVDSSGNISESFVIEVLARVPQQSVVVEWVDRGGVTETRTLTNIADGLLWRQTVTSGQFANGGTMFKVTGTAESGAQQEITTFGRVMFFEALAIPPGRTTVVPAELSYHPDTGYCEDEIVIVSEAVGAIMSDPMAVMVGPSIAPGYPLEAVDSLTDGTRYTTTLGLSELGIATGDASVDMQLSVTRPTGATEVTAVLDVQVPITVLAEGEVCP